VSTSENIIQQVHFIRVGTVRLEVKTHEPLPEEVYHRLAELVSELARFAIWLDNWNEPEAPF
jgi:hypothetical protein